MTKQTTLMSIDFGGFEAGAEEYADMVLMSELCKIMELCLSRLLEQLQQKHAKATFFVQRRALEIDRKGNGKVHRLLKKALAQGHELANYSVQLPSENVDCSSQAIYNSLAICDVELRQLGAQVVGVRSSAMTCNYKSLQQAGALGYRYDSSLLPLPLCEFLKQIALLFARVNGEDVPSVRYGWHEFLGRPLKPHYLAEVGLWQIPVSLPWGPGVIDPKHVAALCSRPQFFHVQLSARDFAQVDFIDRIELSERMKKQLLRLWSCSSVFDRGARLNPGEGMELFASLLQVLSKRGPIHSIRQFFPQQMQRSV